MNRNVWFAIAIAVIAASWFAIDFLVPDEIVASDRTLAQVNAEAAELIKDQPPTKVRGRVSSASTKQRISQLSGRTENKRTVIVRSEVSGLITDRSIELGEQVEAGQALCVVEQEERKARVREAKDLLREAKLEYAGQRALRNNGLQIERLIAGAKARVTQVEAQLLSYETELDRATLKAPFDGFIEEVHVEAGDLLQPGSPCVTLIDLDPMKIVVSASEKDVHYFKIGTEAQARLPSGQIVTGTVSFIGQQSESATRTFMVELMVENPEFTIRSGLTAEILIPLGSYEAHKVPLALLGIDDYGEIGLRLVDKENRVDFRPVQIISEEEDGVWVTGLPEVATLITVGQDFVIPGEKVDVEFEDSI